VRTVGLSSLRTRTSMVLLASSSLSRLWRLCSVRYHNHYRFQYDCTVLQSTKEEGHVMCKEKLHRKGTVRIWCVQSCCRSTSKYIFEYRLLYASFADTTMDLFVFSSVNASLPLKLMATGLSHSLYPSSACGLLQCTVLLATGST